MRVKSTAAALAVGLVSTSVTSAAASLVNGPGPAPVTSSSLVAMPAGPLGGVDLVASPNPSGPSNLGAFTITIAPGTGLATNAPALAAFNRAAQQWANHISDPINVTIDANLTALGSPNVIGSASPMLLAAGYSTLRNQIAADAADGESDDAIVASLPTAGQFSGFLPTGRNFSGSIIIAKANAKAINFNNAFGNLDAQFGVSDGTITFNSAFNFDYDNSDGVGFGQTDFETVAAHEIGHLLGFLSEVDSVDAGATLVDIAPLDLFRFRNDIAGSDPSTAAEFTTSARDFMPGSTAIFDDVDNEWLMSTGVAGGDGRQASHWKDDSLTGNLIGILDPTLPPSVIETVMMSDLRALDVIGYDIVVPEPSTVSLIAAGALLALRRRRRRGA